METRAYWQYFDIVLCCSEGDNSREILMISLACFGYYVVYGKQWFLYNSIEETIIPCLL
jgi:hypothetical protein